MARRRKKIAVEWLESNNKGQMNGVNVMHILGDLSCAAESKEVVVKFGSLTYWSGNPQRGTERARTPTRVSNLYGTAKRRTKLSWAA